MWKACIVDLSQWIWSFLKVWLWNARTKRNSNWESRVSVGRRISVWDSTSEKTTVQILVTEFLFLAIGIVLRIPGAGKRKLQAPLQTGKLSGPQALGYSPNFTKACPEVRTWAKKRLFHTTYYWSTSLRNSLYWLRNFSQDPRNDLFLLRKWSHSQVQRVWKTIVFVSSSKTSTGTEASWCSYQTGRKTDSGLERLGVMWILFFS